MPTLWIARAAYTEMLSEAAARHPRETGGVLLGYEGSGDDVVVTLAIGPGPSARHERSRFVPDHAYHEAEVARSYEGSGRRWTYVGDWHSHPDAPAYLSRTDADTLERIADAVAARMPRPIILILGEIGPTDATDRRRRGAEEWYFGAWRYVRRRGLWSRVAQRRPGAANVVACDVVVF